MRSGYLWGRYLGLSLQYPPLFQIGRQIRADPDCQIGVRTDLVLRWSVFDRMFAAFEPADRGVDSVERTESMQFGQRTFSCIGRLVCALFAQEYGHLFECRKDTGRIVTACRVAVFVIGAVTTIMTFVLNAPVSPIGGQQLSGIMLPIWEWSLRTDRIVLFARSLDPRTLRNDLPLYNEDLLGTIETEFFGGGWAGPGATHVDAISSRNGFLEEGW